MGQSALSPVPFPGKTDSKIAVTLAVVHSATGAISQLYIGHRSTGASTQAPCHTVEEVDVDVEDDVVLVDVVVEFKIIEGDELLVEVGMVLVDDVGVGASSQILPGLLLTYPYGHSSRHSC